MPSAERGGKAIVKWSIIRALVSMQVEGQWGEEGGVSKRKREGGGQQCHHTGGGGTGYTQVRG